MCVFPSTDQHPPLISILLKLFHSKIVVCSVCIQWPASRFWWQPSGCWGCALNSNSRKAHDVQWSGSAHFLQEVCLLLLHFLQLDKLVSGSGLHSRFVSKEEDFSRATSCSAVRGINGSSERKPFQFAHESFLNAFLKTRAKSISNHLQQQHRGWCWRRVHLAGCKQNVVFRLLSSDFLGQLSQ